MINNLDYLSPFRVDNQVFEYYADSIVDMELQTFYDGSVNIITTCAGTAPRIVNSRQRFLSDNVELVVRNAENFDNIYTDITLDKTLLVPILSDIVPVLTFDGVKPDTGKLQHGGYKYYFRFKTADGIESSIFEESRLVSVHTGTEFGKSTSYIDSTITRNSVQFSIANIDTRVYKYVSVYYVRASGEVQPTVKVAYHIDKDYEIVEGTTVGIGTCSIAHTGLEPETTIDQTELTAEYSPIASVSTLTQKNNRLILGNIQIVSTADDRLRLAALKCYIEKDPLSILTVTQKVIGTSNTVDNSYANPSNIYNKLGYFPGETYEFAINFVFRNGSISASYPIMGMDYTIGTSVNMSLDPDDDFVNGWNSYQNTLGVVRMKNINLNTAVGVSPIYAVLSYSMPINTQSMISYLQTTNVDGVTMSDELDIVSYFITRRKRVPDLLMEGLVTLAATAPISSMYPTEMNMHIFGNYLGYGLENGSLGENLVLFPVPGSAMPFSNESLFYTESTGTAKSYVFFDGVLYAPLASKTNNKYYAFYSPDITSDTAKSAILNTRNSYGIVLDSTITQNINYKELNIVPCIGTTTKTRYPYCSTPYNLAQSSGSKEITKIQYVDDGVRSFQSLGFTGRIDRQTSLALYTVLRSYAERGNLSNWADVCAGLRKTYQLTTYGSLNLNTATNKDKVYASHLYLSTDGINECTPGFPKSADNPFSQILMGGVKYSPYLGLIIENFNSLTSLLSIPSTSTDDLRYFSGYSDVADMVPPNNNAVGATKMGTLARIYNQSSGQLTSAEWKTKYSIERPDAYFTISRRFSIDTPLVYTINKDTALLTGGDCYAGLYFQRVWRPGGIDGIPTANNPRNYSSEGDTITRQGVNITNSGYAIGFPVRSAYNFALRALYEADTAETQLYGKQRTYTSANPADETHGNRQAETSVINYGNILEESIVEYSAFDSSIPYIELEYDNRVVVSEISIPGEFENGYRNFKGLNFKDYDNELGKITALVSNGLYTYIVYKNGVSLIEISERSAITNENTGTNVYIASADVLPPKTTPVFSTIGSQHLKSIVPIENGVFGVDADARKIWGVTPNDKKIISDNVIQSLLNRLITDDLKNIIGSYDVMFTEITFTFIYNDDSQRSILFNTKFNLWYGTTDIHKLYQFSIEDTVYSLQKPNTLDVYSLYFPVVNTRRNALYDSVGKALAIDHVEDGDKYTYNSYIEFVVKTDQMSEFSIADIIINGNGIPSSIDVIAESLDEYTINTAPFGVTGIMQNTLPVHTNVYMADAVVTSQITPELARVDDYTFTRVNSTNYKTLAIGDEITLLIGTTYQQFIIANLVPESGATTIIVDSAMIAGDINAMYYGWKVPIRLSIGEIGGGRTDITLPTKKHAALLAGVNNSAQSYHVNYSNAKPYGRWVKLRLHFKGINQIYIDSVISEIVLRYS